MSTPHLSAVVALHKRLKEIADSQSPDIPVSWPNKEFTPPDNSMWLRATFLPGEGAALAQTENSLSEYPGLYQVDVFGPLGEGELPAAELAMIVADGFPLGLSLQEDDLVVRVTRPTSPLPMQRESNWIMIPVRVTWRCYARPQ